MDDGEDDSSSVGYHLGIFIDWHQLVHLVLQSLNAIVHCSDPLHDDDDYDDDYDENVEQCGNNDSVVAFIWICDTVEWQLQSHGSFVLPMALLWCGWDKERGKYPPAEGHPWSLTWPRGWKPGWSTCQTSLALSAGPELHKTFLKNEYAWYDWE